MHLKKKSTRNYFQGKVRWYLCALVQELSLWDPGRQLNADEQVLVERKVLTAIFMKSSIFWHMTPYSALIVNRRFGGQQTKKTIKIKQGFPKISWKLSLNLAFCQQWPLVPSYGTRCWTQEFPPPLYLPTQYVTFIFVVYFWNFRIETDCSVSDYWIRIQLVTALYRLSHKD
jgi:hypothetical protein